MATKKNPWANPDPRLPAVVQLKKVLEMNEAIKAQAERQRRLLWLAVFAAGGRIEIDESDYRMAFEGPATDFFVASRSEKVFDPKLQKEVSKAVLVMVNDKGEVAPESQKKLVVATDG